jgi:WD40 repeat protein
MIHIFDSNNVNLFSSDKEIKTCYGHPVHSMASSPDGKYIAVGDTKGYVTVLNSETREQVFYTAHHNNKMLNVEFTADSSHIVALGFDKKISLVPIEDNKSKRILEGKFNFSLH